MFYDTVRCGYSRFIRKPTALAVTVTVTGLPERNLEMRGSGPIGVRIEASSRICAIVPHDFDH